MRSKLILATTFAAALTTAPAAFAQEVAPDPVTVQKDLGVHSVNLNPLGVLTNSYTLNYEYLLDGTHGFLVEPVLGLASDPDTSTIFYGLDAGYRWHWSGEQDSGFLGANLGFGVGSGEGFVEVDGERTEFPVEFTNWHLTANIGRRWAFDFGLNITARLGAGYGSYDVSTTSDDPNAQTVVRLAQEILEFLPFAFDGELSVGWVF